MRVTCTIILYLSGQCAVCSGTLAELCPGKGRGKGGGGREGESDRAGLPAGQGVE